MGVMIIADSASEVSQETAKEWGIKILPLKIRFGEDEYLDGVTLSNRKFFEKLIESDELPKTSHISPADYEECFQSAIKADCKVFANTRTFYSGATEIFSDFEDYLDNAPAISLQVYVKEKDMNNEIAKQVVNVIPDSRVTCVVTVVGDDLFSDIDRNSETPKGKNVIDMYTFSVKNGQIVRQSWEG